MKKTIGPMLCAVNFQCAEYSGTALINRAPSEVNKERIANLTDRNRQLQSDLKLSEGKAERLRADKVQLTADRDRMKRDLEKSASEIRQLQSALKLSEGKAEGLQAEKKQLTADRDRMKQNLDRLEQELEKVQSENIASDAKNAELVNRISSLERQLKERSSGTSTVPPANTSSAPAAARSVVSNSPAAGASAAGSTSVPAGEIEFGCYPYGSAKKIRWLVRPNRNGTMLICKNALDTRVYESSEGLSKWNHRWDSSELCRWLNDTLLYSAFSPEEQRHIFTASLTTDGKKSAHKLFLLSTDEVSEMLSVSERILSAGSVSVGNSSGKCLWWLRNLYRRDYAYIISYDGSMKCSECNRDKPGIAVRPALYIDPSYLESLR